MSDLCHMFPNLDEKVVEAVLQANNGVVDETIDQLLTMNLDCSTEVGVQATSGAHCGATGAIDKTLDQLLTMNMDCSAEEAAPPAPCKANNEHTLYTSDQDLPPQV